MEETIDIGTLVEDNELSPLTPIPKASKEEPESPELIPIESLLIDALINPTP